MKTITNRDELLTTYRNSNLFIEAGAGAGKTQFISNKTADLILQGVPVDRIVLITFTNKAAEEMLTRISKDLIKKIDKETDINVKNKLLEAKNNLYRLNVSTIHSFCNKLLNENSFLAKIPYNFTLIDEDEEEKRRNDLFSKWYKSLSREDLDNINKLKFIKDKDRISTIKNKYSNLCQYFPDQQINSDVPSDEEFIRYILSTNLLYKVIGNFSSKLSNYYRADVSKFIKAYDELNNAIGEINEDNIKECLTSVTNTIKLKELISAYHGNVDVKGINEKSPGYLIKDKEDYENELEKLEIYRSQKDRMATYQYKYINIYAKKAFDFYNLNCGKDKLSNNQLIYYTYKLLVDKSSNKVKETLAKKYDSIFVDEFQDTDKYQIKFIDELVKAIDERKKKEGIKNTTLIVVGDPKQSIYRFRGADINSFIAYRDDSSFNKEVIYLPDNFRSNDLIIKYINVTYSNPLKVFHPDYKYESMLASSKNEITKERKSLIKEGDNVLAGVYSYIFNLDTKITMFDESGNKIVEPKKSKKAKEEDIKEEIEEIKVSLIENKFNRLVKFIKYLVDKKYKIFKCVDDKYGLYEITYNDFLILTHSKKDMNEYVKTFNRFQIDINVAGEYNLTSSTLFNLVYSLINYVFDPNKNNYKDVKSRFTFSNDNDLDTYLNDLLINIKDMTNYGKLMYILNTLLKQKFYIKGFVDADISTYDTVIHQILEKININNNCDSIHLLKAIDELRSAPSEQQVTLNSDNNAVRIMNMHKSKGLEGNIVIVPDSGSSKLDSNSILFGDVVYMSPNNFSSKIIERNDKEAKEERLRLEYVVASRAKSVLIFEREFSSRSNIFSSNDYCFDNKYLKKFQLDGTELPKDNEITTYYGDAFDYLDNVIEISSNKEYKLENYKEVITSTINSFSPSDLENKDIVVSSSGRTINRPKNNIFGDCLHKGMELLVNDYSIDIDELSTQVVNSYIEDIPTKETNTYIKYLSKCIKAIKSLYDKDSIIKDYEVYPEYKFCAFINEENALVNGSIDLLLIKDNHIKIIDYKSDISGFTDSKSFEGILINRYKPQLEFYKKVINNLFPSSSVDISIIYIEEDNDNEIGHIVKI